MIKISLPPKGKKNLIKPNVTELARMLGKSTTWISLVLHGHKKGTKTRKAIAKALNVPYEELWGKEER